MSRLPTPGSDTGAWGTILNDFLSQAHGTDGTLKANSVTTTAIANSAITAAKIATGAVTKSAVGLGNVDNTADVDKPVSTAQATELNKKYEKPTGGIPATDLSADVQSALGSGGGGSGAPLQLGSSDTVPTGTPAGLIVRLGS